MNAAQERTERPRDPDVAEMLAKEAAAQTCSRAGRPKYWSELSIEEKIERCREQVKAAASQLDILHNICEQQREHIRLLETALQEHRHQIDDGGRVVLPLPTSLNHAPKQLYDRGALDRGAMGSGMIGRPPEGAGNEVYF